MIDLILQYVAWSGIDPSAFWQLIDWEPHPLLINGELAGIGVVNGTEIHFALAPQYRHRGIQRSRAREFLAPLIERRGYLTTRVWFTENEAMRFVERLGFEPTWTDGQVHHYMLSALPFGKEN